MLLDQLYIRQEREHFEGKSANSELSTMKIDVGKRLPDTKQWNLGIFFASFIRACIFWPNLILIKNFYMANTVVFLFKHVQFKEVFLI